MTARFITISAPATTANLGPGFDVFGLAFNEPHDIVKIKINSFKNIQIKILGELDRIIPKNPEKNIAGIVAKNMMKHFSIKSGVTIEINKKIFPGLGLGSSAASAVSVAYGFNRLFNLGLTYEQIISFAVKGEAAIAGSGHADNVAAALYGEFVIVKSYNPIEIISLKAPENMEICVTIPKIKTIRRKTKRARLIIPKKISIERYIKNLGMASAIVYGFVKGDVDLIGKSMIDNIFEPNRATLVPCYYQVKENAINAGAVGFAISGAGPAVLAMVNNKHSSSINVLNAMIKAYKLNDFETISFITKPGKGTYVE